MSHVSRSRDLFFCLALGPSSCESNQISQPKKATVKCGDSILSKAVKKTANSQCNHKSWNKRKKFNKMSILVGLTSKEFIKSSKLGWNRPRLGWIVSAVSTKSPARSNTTNTCTVNDTHAACFLHSIGKDEETVFFIRCWEFFSWGGGGGGQGNTNDALHLRVHRCVAFFL